MSNFVCAHCEVVFPGTPGRPGRHRKFCGNECARESRRQSASFGNNYIQVQAPGHPLVGRNGRAFEHRLVLWNKIGPGTHPCFHCGVAVTWAPGKGNAKGALITDHLDRNPRNNDPENLVPSCPRCNTRNTARAVLNSEDHVVCATGRRLRSERRTCVNCSREFVAWPNKADPTYGTFCSRACRNDYRHRASTAQCGHCGKGVYRPGGGAKYCNRECYRKFRQANPPKQQIMERDCLHCGKRFQRKLSYDPTRGKYCSRLCASNARRGPVKARAASSP